MHAVPRAVLFLAGFRPRQLPASENTDTTAVTFRVLFSKKVREVNAADFTLNTSGGNIRGTLTRIAQEAASTSLTDAVNVVGVDSTTYDVTVRALAGSGTLRLDVKNNNNSIVDVNGNTLFRIYPNSIVVLQCLVHQRCMDFTSSTSNCALLIYVRA